MSTTLLVLSNMIAAGALPVKHAIFQIQSWTSNKVYTEIDILKLKKWYTIHNHGHLYSWWFVWPNSDWTP
jgi:hypothetical protein